MHSEVTLIQGDCLEVMADLDPGSVSLIFADLPYGITHNKWDLPICLKSFWRVARRCQDVSALSILTCTFRFGALLLESNPKNFRYDLVWHKANQSTGFLNASRMPLRAHEHCLVFYEKLPTYNPIKTVGKPWTTTPTKQANNGSNYGTFSKRAQRNDGTRLPTSLLSFKNELGLRKHPTQKPVALLEYLIKTYTKEGDTILDPCAGSGSISIAALNVGGRKVTCIEKDPAYFEVMSTRVAAHKEKLGIK